MHLKSIRYKGCKLFLSPFNVSQRSHKSKFAKPVVGEYYLFYENI